MPSGADRGPALPHPTRVLHVLNGAAGGAAKSTIGLIEGLAERGVESAVVCHVAGSAAEHAALADAVGGRATVTRLYWWNRKTRSPWWRRPLSDARQSMRTRRGRRGAAVVAEAAERWGCDLLHTNTILTPEGGYAAVATGLPHVWHLRELVGPGTPFRFRDERRFFGQRVPRLADALVANSHVALRTVGPFLPPGFGSVVHNGLDLSGFLSLGARPPSPEAAAVVVGMVANLTSDWKRHGAFIDAAARVRADAPVRFVLYGHDPVAEGAPTDYATELHARVVRLGLADRFTFAGFRPDPTTAMAELDLLVHPCPDESFGRIVVEAMASGRPVVGVDGGGVGELVEHGRTGLLVEPGDDEALAAAIGRLVDDPAQRAAMGVEGRRVAQERYTVEAMTSGVLAIYAEVLTSRTDRRRAGGA